MFLLRLLLWLWFFRLLFRAQTDPVETVFVRIEGDASGLLETLEKEVAAMKERLKELEESGQESGKKTKKSWFEAGAIFGLAAKGAGMLLDKVLQLAQAIPAMFISLGKQAVAANAQFETFGVQFETLLGSAGAAQARLEELARFGVETPFELPQIVEASRTLQTFGGTALATGENLKLVGDLAAGVNQPFQSVAFWIGRMYDALENGQPFGEAAMRLQEMGILQCTAFMLLI